MTDVHAPALAAGVRWNDPAFGIGWPITAGVAVAERDASYADFDRRGFEAQLVQCTARSGARAGWT
jgi:dTDP-4-dehydrorhamnose 3,5-epimerase